MSRIDFQEIIEAKRVFDQQDHHIDECTIDELVEFAKEMNIHFVIDDNTSQTYIDRVARIKLRLTDAGIDPDTVRNEYWDNLDV